MSLASALVVAIAMGELSFSVLQTLLEGTWRGDSWPRCLLTVMVLQLSC